MTASGPPGEAASGSQCESAAAWRTLGFPRDPARGAGLVTHSVGAEDSATKSARCPDLCDVLSNHSFIHSFTHSFIPSFDNH